MNILTILTSRCQKLCKSAQWYTGHQILLGRDLSGSTVGVVGLGGIGQAIVRKLKAFDAAKFLYTGPREKMEGK